MDTQAFLIALFYATLFHLVSPPPFGLWSVHIEVLKDQETKQCDIISGSRDTSGSVSVSDCLHFQLGVPE